jgi:UDP-glucose:(heptosyl)LPS alpha-1,3-glucosyltransferase
MENALISNKPKRTRETELRVALCHSGCHRKGGVERVVWESARILKKSVAVTVLAREFAAGGQGPAGVNSVRLRSPTLPLGLSLRGIRKECDRLVAENRFDVVGGFGVQAPENSVVWIQSVHAAWWAHSRRCRSGLSRWMQALNPFHRIVLSMERELLQERRYRKLIALSSGVVEDLRFFYGVPSRDIEVLPNGFNPNEFNLGLRGLYRDKKRRELGIAEDAWVILFVGNEWERKGLFPLLRAVAAYGQKNVHVVAAGRLPAPLVERVAAGLNLRGRVHVVGSTAEVNRWFGMADVFALPTVYEAWGMVVIEALAAGLPVLTSRLAGASEAISDGKNGVLLENPVAVEEIVEGLKQIRNGLGWTSAEVSRKADLYNWNYIIERYESILRRAASMN